MEVNFRTIKPAVGMTAKSFSKKVGWEVSDHFCKNRHGVGCGCSPEMGTSCVMCRGELDEEIVASRAKKGYGSEYHFLTKSGVWLLYTPSTKLFHNLQATKQETEKWFRL